MAPGKTAADMASPSGASARVAFDDNGLALALFGSHHCHLARLEQELDVDIRTRGNEVTLAGHADAVDGARRVLDSLYARLRDGRDIDMADVDAALRMVASPAGSLADAEVVIQTRNRRIAALFD